MSAFCSLPRIFIAFVVLTAAFGASPGNALAADGPKDRTVILVGIDGLRWDIIDRHPAPHLNALAKSGVRAQGLIPVMPSSTFPNFYAIATGLKPENNGVLSNRTYDRESGTLFRLGLSSSDARWFKGEPIWAVAERQGVITATYFWVGSEVESDAGIRPTYWQKYDHNRPHVNRVAQVMQWLDLPEAFRPRLICLYFSVVDSASHRYSVDSKEERAAIADVDAQVGTLIEALKRRGLMNTTDLIFLATTA